MNLMVDWLFNSHHLAAHDRYHYREGYTCARAGLAAHIIDKQLGLIGSLFSPVR